LKFRVDFEKSRNITPFGHYKNNSVAEIGTFAENDKKVLMNIVEEIVKKNLEEYKANIIEDITQKK